MTFYFGWYSIYVHFAWKPATNALQYRSHHHDGRRTFLLSTFARLFSLIAFVVYSIILTNSVFVRVGGVSKHIFKKQIPSFHHHHI
jgi:hypothetical protein